MDAIGCKHNLNINRSKMNEYKSVAVVGFGYIGSVIGAVIASRGYKVYGIESAPSIVSKVSQGLSPFNEPQLETYISKEVSSGRLLIGK